MSTPEPRADGRLPDELRPVSFERDFTDMSAGSVLVTFGRTRVLCTASIEDDVPRWMRGSGKGWVTAEYSMLPGSSPERIRREVKDGKPSGRTQEIQRLIGRSLRSVCDMVALGERSIMVDCDVLQADGGTRTASISGGYVALHDALTRLVATGELAANPLVENCAAISVGIVGGRPLLDLPYIEDSKAEVDMNVVMTASGRFVEVQGTAEGQAFSRAELDELLDLAGGGINQIIALQNEAVATPPTPAVNLVMASANPDKVAEIAAILGDAVELAPRPPGLADVVEDGETLEDNARLKAVAVCEAAGAGAVADDTGLEVDALGGAPGVYTARFAGEDATYADNVAKMLNDLSGVPEAERTARFRTVALVRYPDGSEVVAEGIVEGCIATQAVGDRGFGYDPLFIPDDGDGRTFAQMSADEKHAVSHRGRAFRALAEKLSS